MVKQHGFTLVEIMIAVAVVAILAAIAIPSYERHKIKVSRVAAQSEMMEIGATLNQYLVIHRSLLVEQSPGKGPEQLVPNTIPKHDSPFYRVKLEIPKANSWQLIATPIEKTRQANDGILVLTSKGYRCWDKENKGICNEKDKSGKYKITAIMNWDGR